MVLYGPTATLASCESRSGSDFAKSASQLPECASTPSALILDSRSAKGWITLFERRAPKLQQKQTKVSSLQTHLHTKNICSTRNVCFVFMVAKAVLHLGYNITAVHEPESHVLSWQGPHFTNMEARSKTVMVVSAAGGCWAFSAECCATQCEGAVWTPNSSETERCPR